MTQAKKTFQPVSSKNVCRIYELLHENDLVSFPLTADARAKTEALVSSVTAEYFGVPTFETPEKKAVAYLFFIIRDHPFTDGNKRTATLTFEVVCAINGLTPVYDDFSLDELAVYIEKTQEADHRIVIEALAQLIFPQKRTQNG